MPKTQTQAQTFSASILAAKISKVLGRTVSPKQVRGRARGDSGTPLLARYAPGTKAPYASHVYSAADADRLGQAFVDAHNKRSDKPVRWTPLNTATRKPRASRGTSAAHAAPQTDNATTE